jgi:hypothetical protein
MTDSATFDDDPELRQRIREAGIKPPPLSALKPRGNGHAQKPPADEKDDPGPDALENYGLSEGERDEGDAGTSANGADLVHTEPVDLWAKFEPPPLPIGLLPETIENFATRHAETMGCDAGGLAAAALAVCAASITDRIQLQVKKYDRHWTEPARIWVGLIGDPSTKKSPIIRQAARPLVTMDGRLFHQYSEAKKRHDALPEADRKLAKEPKQKRLRFEDTTIEAAQEIFKDNPDGVLCLQDELGGWFGSMDKYSGQGAAKDRGFWLQVYNGGSYRVDRVRRGSFLIENLSASMLGGIQPAVICKVAGDGVDDGLLQRLLPIVVRPATQSRDEPRPHEADHYSSLIEQLAGLQPRTLAGADVVLRYDDAAQAIRQKLEGKHLELMGFEAINKKLAAHIGKYDGIFARLCVLWHCINNAHEFDLPPDVTEDTARRVADFMHRFLLPHALAFYGGVLDLSDGHDRLAAVAGYILAHKLERLTNRDVQRGDRTMRGLSKRDMEAVFDQLDALGWINRVAAPRPADPPHLIVNPLVHTRFGKRAKQEAARRKAFREVISAKAAQGNRDRAELEDDDASTDDD